MARREVSKYSSRAFLERKQTMWQALQALEKHQPKRKREKKIREIKSNYYLKRTCVSVDY